MTYFLISSLLLAALLYFPLSKLIWVLSVRRLQRKADHELSENEIQGQLKRARFISVFVSLLFSLLFNINLTGFPNHG
jgi:hypothetical protein